MKLNGIGFFIFLLLFGKNLLNFLQPSKKCGRESFDPIFGIFYIKKLGEKQWLVHSLQYLTDNELFDCNQFAQKKT